MGFIKAIFSTLLLLGYLLVSVHSIDPETDEQSSFSYDDGAPNGPQNWGYLNYPKWIMCGIGERQSPIDIPVNWPQWSPDLGPLIKHYVSAPATIRNRGHDIAVVWGGVAGGIIINDAEYNLQQVHWHTPSEHTLNGQRYPMELHLVHTNSKDEIAVIGVLYEFGAPDSFLQKVLPFLPTVDQQGTELGSVDPSEIGFNVDSYYRYDGSLTTPPCSQDVLWTLSKKVNTVSWEQYTALREAIHDGYAGNARPIQPLNERKVYEYGIWKQKMISEM